ncbi:ATP-dependent helicase [Peribacillus tepidiphilus]|uniref:ATP-dependent helicase n=1 Tax=Peribacillus tepidiphilus TaxID=2652445 RepID=UPI0012915978|nr:ATP-dependent helicase [Peribacillus tepidiphilus]
MKLAKFNQETIDLAKLSSDRFSIIYDSAKRDLITCLKCGKPVRLYLGMHEEPYFFHDGSIEKFCDVDTSENSSTFISQEQMYVERNGFRIPVSRSITAEKPLPGSSSFRVSTRIQNNPPFLQKDIPNEDLLPSYLEKLRQEGITLDREQRRAVTSIHGPLLVLSGAGSGKTRVLTARTAYMIQEEKVLPKEIMLVTFTAKAAKEMKDRLLTYPDMTGDIVNQLVTGTFHSIFYRILMFHERNKWTRDALIKYDWEKETILKAAGRDLGLDEKEFAYDQAIAQIGLWKNSLLFPSDLRASDAFEESCLSLYAKYEEYKNETGRYDFDDMLVGCYRLLKESPDLLHFYQNRFRYFLIDEFQDINKVQYELIKLLAKSHQNICAVGDDDQAIYSFRGSDPAYILNFDKDFPHAKVITLTENYRSSHEIVATANRIISKNEKRKPKRMTAQHNFGDAPALFYPYDEEMEAIMVLTDIQEKIRQGANPSEFAILYRTHTMSRAIFERLAQSNLPFVIEKDAESFYDRKNVRSILAFLKLSLNPHDSTAIGEILPSLFLKGSILKELKAQTILQDCDYISALGHVKTGFSFQEKKLQKLPAILRGLKDMSPVVAIEVIEKDIGFSDYLKKRGSEVSRLEKGSDDLKDLKVAAKKFRSVLEFVEHANHMRAMNKEVKELSKHFREAISLLTIHRSKGLEFPYVYVLSAVDGSIPHDYALEDLRNGNKDALEEERRLMYVAATRAIKELNISIPQTRRGREAYPSRFLKI